MFQLSAVIPTRNRPDDLAKAVASICAQTRLPNEFIIVDQSFGDESRVIVESLVLDRPGIRLVYVHDARIGGLVEAKHVAVERANGDIVCFLEDDVVLEPDYLEQMERGFIERPNMVGCCGVVINLPPQPRCYVGLFHLFHRGIFHDPRVGVYGDQDFGGPFFIPSKYLSGGLSAYRREVFKAVAFDIQNDFFMLEDIDFSTRAALHFGERFFINRQARLDHKMSPLNRAVLGLRQRRKLREFLVFYKKRRRDSNIVIASWLLTGLLLEAAYQATKARSPLPIVGYILGFWDGLRWKVREVRNEGGR